MIKVMFVCHGNICRSPMAEFIMRDMISKSKELYGKVTVSSAATSTEEIWNGIGNPVYPPAKTELAKHNLNCQGKRAVQLKKSDYNDYNYLIAMDDTNLRNMHRIIGNDPYGKICKLLDFTSHGGNVADPWYTNRFDIAYADIYEGCSALKAHLISLLEEEK